MKPTELMKLIADRHKAGITRPLLVESSPGLGKTQIAAQAAKSLNVGFKAIHAPLLQPEDYGFPVISKERDAVSFVVDREKFPMSDSECPETGILLIDELSQADVAGQKILTNLVHEREIHGMKLKAGWSIVCTGNRTTDRAGANRILSHLGNRVTRVELEPSLDDWTNWALTNEVKPEVIAFIRFRPDLLTDFNPQNDVSATPRAWVDGVSAALGVVDKGAEFEVFKGDVGQGPASEFLGFLKVYRKLPSIDAILLNPKKSDVPKDPATLYAVCAALAHQTAVDNFGRIMQYVMRLPAEFSVLYIRDATTRVPEVTNTKDFVQWAAGPGAKLLVR